MITTGSIGERIYDLLMNSTELTDEAKKCVKEDYTKYGDKALWDKIDGLRVIIVSPKYGTNHIKNPEWMRSDPWRVTKFAAENKGYISVVVLPEPDTDRFVVEIIPLDEAQTILRGYIKAAGLPPTPEFNNIVGYLPTFDEFLGSVPEHMREVLERPFVDQDQGIYKERAGVAELREWYQREVETILGYLRKKTRMQRVETDDPDKYKYVEVPVSKISFSMNLFDQVPDGAGQSVADFYVSDISPYFNPPPQINWHGNDYSRWMYAGGISINYYKNEETGEETCRISSNH